MAFAFKELELQWRRYTYSDLNLFQASWIYATISTNNGATATEEGPSISRDGTSGKEDFKEAEMLSYVLKQEKNSSEECILG